MQTAFSKLLLLPPTLPLVAPLSQARFLAFDNCGVHQWQMNMRRIAVSSVAPKQMGLLRQAAFLQSTSKAASVPGCLQQNTDHANKWCVFSRPLTANHVSSQEVEPHDQIVGGLSLGSVLSAGSAQQSVNQESVRDKPAKQDAAKEDSEKKNSQSRRTRDEDAMPTGKFGGTSNIEAVGESGNGSTASGATEACSSDLAYRKTGRQRL